MAASDISEKILDHIRQHGPSKAIQIANALGVERSVVNSALYGPLRGKVRQSRDYKWSLADVPQTRQDADATVANSRTSLFTTIWTVCRKTTIAASEPLQIPNSSLITSNLMNGPWSRLKRILETKQ